MISTSGEALISSGFMMKASLQETLFDVNHRTNVSKPQLKSTQMKDKSVTACNDSLKSRTSNVNVVCGTCGKYVFNSNHDACVSKYLNDVNARTKKPKVVPISTRKPKSQVNKSVATHRKKTVASESTVQNSKSYYRMLYEKTRTSPFWCNDSIAPILGYKNGQEISTINRVYYIEAQHNLFSVVQFVMPIWRTTTPTPICTHAKASPTQHGYGIRRLFISLRLHQLAFTEVGCRIVLPKVEIRQRSTYAPLWKLTYSNTTWTHLSRSKDETPEVLKDFLTMIQRNLQAPVISVQTDRGTEFLNKTLNAFFKEEGIEH
ncbi:retrovirus-related pol polyprotein from transposon TNT 1-94 [Tanacetum coccineum]